MSAYILKNQKVAVVLNCGQMIDLVTGSLSTEV